MGSGVEPGMTTAEDFDVKCAAFEVGAVDAGDFEFSAGGRLDVLGDADDVAVIEVAAGDGEVGFGIRWLFLHRDGLASGIEFDDTEALRIMYLIAEGGAPVLRRAAALSLGEKPWP